MANKSIEKVNAFIFKQLEAGTIPWRKSWTVQRQQPTNPISGTKYSGINWFILSLTGSSYCQYVTFNQAKQAGGSVKKKDQHIIGGIPVIKYGYYEREDKKTGEKTEGQYLKHYTVFALEDCEGLDHLKVEPPLPEGNDNSRISHCERIIEGNIHNTSYGNPAYSSALDVVRMPRIEEFESSEEYYAAYFHELTHWTMHKKRCNREREEGRSFGDHEYSKEELVAEMGAAYLCAHAGIDQPVIENNAAYIQSWLKVLKGNKNYLVSAAAQAQKAFNFLTAFEQAKEEAA